MKQKFILRFIMKFQIHTQLIFLLFVLLSGCKTDCTEQKDIFKNLQDKDIKKIPYKGLDTLTFLRNSKDTYLFYSLPIEKLYEIKQEMYTESCGFREKVHYENNIYTFKCDKLNEKISIKIYMPLIMIYQIKQWLKE